MNEIVCLKYLEEYDVDSAVKVIEQAFSKMHKLEQIFKPGMKVLLKVCMPSADSPDKALTTHPVIVRAVVDCLNKYGVKCIIADSPYKFFNESKLEKLYLDTGMLEVANLTNCELNRNVGVTKLEIPDGVRAKYLQLMDAVNDVDLIVNLGKIKVDKDIGFSGACANIFGLVPGEIKTQIINRTDTYKDFNNYIIDILEALNDKLVLNILDGVVALENKQTQRMLSLVAVSTNPYVLDSAVFKVVGLDETNTVLKQAEKRGRFSFKEEYEIAGDDLDKFTITDFALPRITESTKINKANIIKQKLYYIACQERVDIVPNTCKGCGVCSKICPSNAIMMKTDKNGELYAHIDYKACIYCNKCYLGCPYEVVQLITPIGYKIIQNHLLKKQKK